MSLNERRAEVLTRSGLATEDLPGALSAATDQWLRELFEAEVPVTAGVALVAVGGYGRAELCPGSDLDLLLLHAEREDASEIAERIWYPIWDEGQKLGHAVRTIEECLLLGRSDLESATGFLSIRHVAGDRQLTEQLMESTTREWVAGDRIEELARSVDKRHRLAGEVAFLLEPDLKEGRGGLRDVHALRWAQLAGVVIEPADGVLLDEAYRTLLRARVELHRRTGKRGDVLLLEEQDAVADALDEPDADVFMGTVASAARAIGYLSDEIWRRVSAASLDRPESNPISVPGLEIGDGEIEVVGDPATDPLLVLHAAVHAARSEMSISRSSLARFSERQLDLPDPWPAGARELFVELLSLGHRAIPVIESLDFFEVWTRVVPEWAPNRSRPQRNVYHRFTVDRHLLEAAAEAARLAQRVNRPDLLVVGALLHDIGKGYPGDHTEVGMRLVRPMMRRMGFPEDDADAVVRLVQHHLLLPDVATRRDLEDEQTLSAVAESVGDVGFLELLAALTEADSLATGPTAWGSWKEQLVRTLTDATAEFLSGGVRTSTRRSFVTDEIEALMAAGEMNVSGAGDRLTVIAPDQAGVFSRAAGALSLRGLDVLQADAYSSSAGMAVSVFRVAQPDAPVDWDRITHDVRRALKGYLAIDARIAERARVYRRRSALAAEAPETAVLFDTDSATDATIIEVRTGDHVGVLYQVTRIMAEMGLDIRYAKIQTLAHEVVDSFYVTGPDGPMLDDLHQREISLALSHGLSLMSG